jgi:chromosome segregation and condensation protein ScpB
MTNQPETDLGSVLEAILFAAERPLSLIELSEVIRTVEEVIIEPESIQALLEGVRARLEAEGRGMLIHYLLLLFVLYSFLTGLQLAFL